MPAKRRNAFTHDRYAHAGARPRHRCLCGDYKDSRINLGRFICRRWIFHPAGGPLAHLSPAALSHADAEGWITPRGAGRNVGDRKILRLSRIGRPGACNSLLAITLRRTKRPRPYCRLDRARMPRSSEDRIRGGYPVCRHPPPKAQSCLVECIHVLAAASVKRDVSAVARGGRSAVLLFFKTKDDFRQPISQDLIRFLEELESNDGQHGFIKHALRLRSLVP